MAGCETLDSVVESKMQVLTRQNFCSCGNLLASKRSETAVHMKKDRKIAAALIVAAIKEAEIYQFMVVSFRCCFFRQDNQPKGVEYKIFKKAIHT